MYDALPSVFVTASATSSERASLSEADALAPDATSVADAVLTSGSVVMPAANATGTVNTTLLPAPAAIVAPVVPKLVWPIVPVTVPQLAAPTGAHDAFADSVTPAGSASVTVTLAAADGPPLVTVIV